MLIVTALFVSLLTSGYLAHFLLLSSYRFLPQMDIFIPMVIILSSFHRKNSYCKDNRGVSGYQIFIVTCTELRPKFFIDGLILLGYAFK